jgi:hypothetical protein
MDADAAAEDEDTDADEDEGAIVVADADADADAIGLLIDMPVEEPLEGDGGGVVALRFEPTLVTKSVVVVVVVVVARAVVAFDTRRDVDCCRARRASLAFNRFEAHFSFNVAI